MEWGKLGTINVYGCNPKKIRSKKHIRNFVKILCEGIGMERKGPCRIKRFGKDDLEGYSAIQFIEYSSITIHFDEIENRAFIDIFSCKDFDVKRAENFSKKFFNGKKSSSKILARK
jgi:S-adenosylmethionine/arginine decarboxylase-like enzyme